MVKRFSVVLAVIVLAWVGSDAQQGGGSGGPVFGASGTAGVYVLPVRGNIYMLVGAGANIAISAGRKDGILLVDSGRSDTSDQVLGAVRHLAERLDITKPLRYIINTSDGPDHTGGNASVATAGRSFVGGIVVSPLDANLADAGTQAAILAHENVLRRLSARARAGEVPFVALPTDTYYRDSMKLSHFFNDEGIRLIHQPAAISDGDSLVYFRGSDVLVAGDIFDTTTYPRIDLERGGRVQGVIDGLNRILDIAIPESSLTEGGTMVVPGRGRLADAADVAYYRDMVAIVRDRVQHLIDQGLTLEQVKAARPTRDYDTRYGLDDQWTPDRFIEAVYLSLTSADGGRGTVAKF